MTTTPHKLAPPGIAAARLSHPSFHLGHIIQQALGLDVDVAEPSNVTDLTINLRLICSNR